MSVEDEKVLQNGPLPCPWKNYANELICLSGCGNFEKIKNQLIEAQKRAEEQGTSISISEMVQGIRDGKLGIIEPDKLDRRKCKEQPRIPVVGINLNLKSPFED